MRQIRIYQPGNYGLGETLILSEAAGHHVGVVLRLKPSDTIILFSGDNREFEAKLISVYKKKVTVIIEAMRQVSRESPRPIHLAQAISKGERMEFVMQKSVELGVASIRPLISSRSVVKLDEERIEKKLAQWQAIVIAACEQSGRNTIPKVHPLMNLNEYLLKAKNLKNFVLDVEGKKSWRDYQFAEQEIGLLIGPEGGFSEEEFEQIYKANFNPLSLGPRILRTETAALSAITLLQAVCGDL